MSVHVKICGVTNAVDAALVASAGADAIGFILTESRLKVDIETARRLASALPSHVSKVAVLRYPTDMEVDSALNQLAPALIQAEPGRHVLRAVPAERLLPVFHDSESVVERVGRLRESYPSIGAIVLDWQGRGAGGIRGRWHRARQAAELGPLVLAGGLSADNVEEAVLTVRPHGVDVSHGVEGAPGRKDPDKVRAFIEAVRATEARM